MIIKRIHLRDYRNISRLDLTLKDDLNIIIGPNGAGKTNILESLLVTSNTKSFRTSRDTDLIQKGKDFSLIDITADQHFRVVISHKGKSFFIDEKMIARSSSFIGKMNCLLFKPSDLGLFDDSSKERRKLFDIELGKIDFPYLQALLNYLKLLKDKNHLLKALNVDETYLSSLEEMMVPYIETIITERIKLIDYLNQNINDCYYALANDQTPISLVYRNTLSDDQQFIEALKQNHERDRLYHCATIGPHRDDILFKFGNYSLESIASQGQKRLVMIAFKLTLSKYIEKVTGQKPIILLDDILSELDIANRTRLLDYLHDIGQTIITATDINGLKLTYPARVITINKGAVYDINDR